MNWNAAAVLLTAWSLATVNAILDSTGQRHWDDGKPDEPDHYPNENMLKTYVVRGGNKHFVTSVFPEMDARGFHEYVFDGLQPDFQWPSIKFKRNYYPQGITSRGGFSDDIFHQSFGMFEPLKRSVSRTSPSVANLLRRLQSPGVVAAAVRQQRRGVAAAGGAGAAVDKRRPEMDANGFHGDSFTGGMDRFDTMKRRPEMDANGFHGDSFTGGMDRFDTMKRRPEMDANGFHGDSFTGGMDRFDTMKRRPEMDATGFEDSFGNFGRFETMKRRDKSPSAAAAARFNP